MLKIHRIGCFTAGHSLKSSALASARPKRAITNFAGVAQLGEEKPNVQWTFAVGRPVGGMPDWHRLAAKRGQESECQTSKIFYKKLV